jgi:hypothetical protein
MVILTHGLVQPVLGKFYQKVKNQLKWEKFAPIAQAVEPAIKKQLGNSALIAEFQ